MKTGVVSGPGGRNTAGRDDAGRWPRPVLAATLAAAACLFTTDVWSYDFWWHLAAGRWIVEKGGVPAADPFSFVYGGSPWIDLQWLFQVVVFGLHSAAGLAGPILFKTAVLVAAVAVLVRTAGGGVRYPHAGALAWCVVFALSYRAAVRPECLSFLGVAVFLAVLERFRRRGGTRWIWALPLATALWVNCHGLFVLGPLLILAYLAGLLLERAAGRPSADAGAPPPRALAGLALALCLCAPAALLNPYGLDGALHPFTLFTRISGADPLYRVIGEFAPPEFENLARLQPNLVAYALLLLAGAATTLANLRRVSLAQLFSAAMMQYLAMRANRNIPFFALAAFVLVAGNLACRSPARSPGRLAAWVATAAAVGLAAAVTIPVRFAGGTSSLYYRYWARDLRRAGLGASHVFPEKSLDYLIAARPGGRVYCDLNFGGYFIWRGWWARPRLEVFIDGRLEVVPRQHLAAYVVALFPPVPDEWPRERLERRQRALAAWNQFVEVHDLRTALINDRAPTVPFVRGSPRWRLVFQDAAARSSVYVRRAREGR